MFFLRKKDDIEQIEPVPVYTIPDLQWEYEPYRTLCTYEKGYKAIEDLGQQAANLDYDAVIGLVCQPNSEYSVCTYGTAILYIRNKNGNLVHKRRNDIRFPEEEELFIDNTTAELENAN